MAEKLFVTKDFDNTGTNDILNEIGIARGTLYYHFKSKTDILDAMIGRITKQLVERAGICQTENSLEVAKMTFLYSTTVFDTLDHHSEEDKNKKDCLYL